jgi:hypothetical protein
MGPIILCHAFEDKKVVSHVYDALQASGFEVWIDAESVFGEPEWEPDMAKWLRQADCMLVFLSKNSVRKLGSTQHEFGQLIDTWKAMPEGTVYTIPVRINDCQIPELLSRLDHIDLFAEQGLETIIRCLHEGRATHQMPRPHIEAQEGERPSQVEVPEEASGAFHLAVDGRGQVVDVPGALSDSPVGGDLTTETIAQKTIGKKRHKKTKP